MYISKAERINVGINILPRLYAFISCDIVVATHSADIAPPPSTVVVAWVRRGSRFQRFPGGAPKR